MPKKKPNKDASITARLDSKTLKKICDFESNTHISKSALVRAAIVQFFENNKTVEELILASASAHRNMDSAKKARAA